MSGSNLTDLITATAPSGYEVALESATAGIPGIFGASVTTAAPSSGTVASTKIYVRLTGTTLGTYGTSAAPFNVVHTSTGVSPDVSKPVYGTVVAPTPLITITPTTTLSFATTPGTPSAEQSYTVDGSNLTANLTVTAPAGYEISLTSGTYTGTTANVLTLTPSSGTVTTTTIYVILTSATAGTFGTSGTPFNIAHTSTGATTKNKPVYGTVAAPTPTITVTPPTALSFATTTGTPSAEQSYTVNASNLTANLTLIAPAGYEISLTSGTYTGTGANTLTLTPSGGTVGTTIVYVRLTGAAVGTFGTSGTPVNIAHTSTGATTANKPVYGAVANPTITTGTISATAICASTDASITVNFTTSGPFNGTYSAQLSNPSGTFGAFTNLTVTSSTATSLTVTIPAGTSNGTGYKVRVINSSPAINGSASTSTLIIVNNPTAAITPIATQNNGTAANGTTLTATETPAGVSRQWYYSTVTGGPYTNVISGATGTTYVPNFGTAGTYYVVVQSTFAACGSVTSNEVRINVVDAVLTVAPAALNSFSTTVGTASAIQSFILTGTNLSGPVAVTPPSGYEAAVSSGGTYRTTALSISQTNATAGQSIFVRLAAATPAGTYGTPAAPFYIDNTATGAVTKSVAVDGIVAPLTPAIVANPSSLAVFTATVGTASVAQSYTLTPTALSAPITVTAPTGYEVSLALGSGYAASVSASQTATTTIYVRLAASAALGVYNGTVTNVSGSVSQGVPVKGGVSPAPVAGGPGLLVLEEDFDYPNGTVLTNTSNWEELSSGGVTPNIITVAGPSLGFDQYGSPARIGGAVSISNGQDIARGFSVPANTTDYYVSTLINVGSASGSDYFFSLMPTATATSYAARVFVKSSGGGVQFGIGYFNNAEVYAPTIYALSTSYTLVVRYIKNPGPLDDALELYVLTPLPTGGIPLVKPSPSASAIGYSTNESTPGAVAIRQAVISQSISLDGIRAGTGWGAVVGRPVYTAASAIINPGYYYDVTVNNTNTLTLAGPATVENQLILTKGLVNTTAENLLTLAATATVAASPANTFAPLSFVSGPLARQTPAVGSTPTDFMFPVGKVSTYRPLTLSVTNQAATTYTAEQLEGAPTASTLPAGVTRVSGIRSFTLTPNVQPVIATPSFQAALTIPFGPSDYVNDPATLVMVKRPTSAAAWESIGNAANTGISTVGPGDDKRSVAGTLTSTPFSSFSEFALATTNTDLTINPLSASAGTPLPVELTSFSAQRRADKEVDVKWATASEKNSNYFQVQRSLDGRDFATVATVTARGNSSQATAYTALDKAAPTAQLYYRLRQVDLDGTATFSPVVVVSGTGRATVQLYPNPATEVLHVEVAAATPYRVLNLLGQPVLTGTTTESTTLNVRTLPAGAYLLELHTAQGRQVSKFTKE